MSSGADAQDDVIFVDLEFDTGATGGALLGDIASSLVTIDELLRDLGSMAAYPASVEFRTIEIVAIEMRSPLRVRLSLVAIPAEAVRAFQMICREIILFRERHARAVPLTPSEWDDVSAKRLANITAATDSCSSGGAGRARITDQEANRISRHIVTLETAAIRLKRIEVVPR